MPEPHIAEKLADNLHKIDPYLPILICEPDDMSSKRRLHRSFDYKILYCGWNVYVTIISSGDIYRAYRYELHINEQVIDPDKSASILLYYECLFHAEDGDLDDMEFISLLYRLIITFITYHSGV
jgi:hypothetical protein